MKYKVLLHDSVIVTDDYDKSEMDLLKKNIVSDLNRYEVDYPVPVLDENNRIVFELVP